MSGFRSRRRCARGPRRCLAPIRRGSIACPRVRSTIGCPPSSTTPASNDVRVRVDGAWNISATVARCRASELSGARLSSAARSSNRSSSIGGQLVSGDEVARQARQCTLGTVRLRVLTWNLFHGRSVPPIGAGFARRVRARCSPAGSGMSHCSRRCRRGGRRGWRSGCAASSPRSSRRATRLLPLRRLLAERWPDVMRVGRRRRQRHPGADRPDLRAPLGAAVPASGAPHGRMASSSATGYGWSISTRPRTIPSAPGRTSR